MGEVLIFFVGGKMRLTPKFFNGAIIKEIKVYSDSDVQEGNYVEQYCPYRLVIKTDRGEFIFEGCHDAGADVIINGEDYYDDGDEI